MENNLDKIREFLETAKELLEKAKDPASLDNVQAKIRAEMDKRKFGEADATKHVIDRDRGEIKTPKAPKPLLQSEDIEGEGDFRTDAPPVHDGKKNIYFNKSGQWSFSKDDSVKPFGESVYNSTANLNRKATRTGEVREEAGKNQAVRSYTTPGSSIQAAHEAAEAKTRKKNPAPVKVYTKEEREALQAKLKKSEDLTKAMGWSYNGSTGNFNHGLHGSVAIRPHENPAKGFEVVHNAKIISSHGPEDKAGAINSAATHMKGLSSASGSRMVNKEEVSENKDKFGSGED